MAPVVSQALIEPDRIDLPAKLVHAAASRGRSHTERWARVRAAIALSQRASV
jgi:hypothetical protein